MISDQNSNLVVVDNHMDVPKDYSFGVCEPVCGLLCTRDEWVLSRKKDARMMICNQTRREEVYTEQSSVVNFNKEVEEFVMAVLKVELQALSCGILILKKRNGQGIFTYFRLCGSRLLRRLEFTLLG
ncbi:unnamed protein product [Arabidopsis lyrata]|nr:unnamed protein product [Arabidopsis lyrata]